MMVRVMLVQLQRSVCVDQCAMVMCWCGIVCLSHCGDPIIVNPTNIPEATAVAEWWKNHDKKIIGHNVRVSMNK